MEEVSIKFSSNKYPEGIEYDIIPASGSTTGITFFSATRTDFINKEEFTSLTHGIKEFKNFWHKSNIDSTYILVPKKRKNGDGV